MQGISLDENWLIQESKDLENDLKNLETKIFELCGEEFNMNSPKQLSEILFEKLKLDPKAKKPKLVNTLLRKIFCRNWLLNMRLYNTF